MKSRNTILNLFVNLVTDHIEHELGVVENNLGKNVEESVVVTVDTQYNTGNRPPL